MLLKFMKSRFLSSSESSRRSVIYQIAESLVPGTILSNSLPITDRYDAVLSDNITGIQDFISVSCEVVSLDLLIVSFEYDNDIQKLYLQSTSNEVRFKIETNNIQSEYCRMFVGSTGTAVQQQENATKDAFIIYLHISKNLSYLVSAPLITQSIHISALNTRSMKPEILFILTRRDLIPKFEDNIEVDDYILLSITSNLVASNDISHNRTKTVNYVSLRPTHFKTLMSDNVGAIKTARHKMSVITTSNDMIFNIPIEYVSAILNGEITRYTPEKIVVDNTEYLLAYSNNLQTNLLLGIVYV